ncbi:MAG: O-acetyl-ADP-ribose deacetylase [Desulfobulbia bacterium]
MSAEIKIIISDITTLNVDAIVNAANNSLLGGGGVDGAIHRAAGPELVEACKILRGCQTGQVKITEGFNLKARYVIHAVGPVWQGGSADEHQLLVNCYQSSIRIADEIQLKSLAFPSISTGAYGFPGDIAARIAVETTLSLLAESPAIDNLIFCCFDQKSAENYISALNVVSAEHSWF